VTLPWFDHWLDRHLERHQSTDLPKPIEKPRFYEAWHDELARLRVTEQAADIASVRLVSVPTAVQWHFKKLVKIALAVNPPAAGVTDRAAALDASKSCPKCYGEGVVSVVSELDGTGQAAHCTCPYGHHLFNERRREGLKVLDFADVIARKRFRVGADGEPFRYVRQEDADARAIDARRVRSAARDEQRPALPGRAAPRIATSRPNLR
jgi:hypothetical protein